MNKVMYHDAERMYEQMVLGWFYDDKPPSTEEQQNLLIKAGLRAGWDDPEMDIYNDLDPRRNL